MPLDALKPDVTEQFFTMLCDLQQEGKSASNITYGLNGDQREQLLVDCGTGIRSLLNDHPELVLDIALLERIYREQYAEVADPTNGQEPPEDPQTAPPIILPKKSSEVPSGSLRSPHDPQAAYRKKGNGAHTQIISGYHANITETCGSPGEVDLIIEVSTEPANMSEDKFLLKAIEKAQTILTNAEAGTLEVVITDGGYDSNDNRTEMVSEGTPTWHIAKQKGHKRAYVISYGKDKELQVYEVTTGKPCKVSWSEREQKYRIDRQSGRQGYFTPEQIEHYMLAQSILKHATEEGACLRATVESTINQMFHRLKKNNKMPYRGLYQCHRCVVSRAMWTNFRRLRDWTCLQQVTNGHFAAIYCYQT